MLDDAIAAQAAGGQPLIGPKSVLWKMYMWPVIQSLAVGEAHLQEVAAAGAGLGLAGD